MSKPNALDRLHTLMSDGEARSFSRIYYLTGVSPTAIRRAVSAGFLEKVGEDHPRSPRAKRGQAILKIKCPLNKLQKSA